MRLSPFLLTTLLAGATAHLSAATSTTCSARLPDGRSFLTGGTTSAAQNADPIATTHFFENDGSLKPAAPMLAAHAAHVCIALQDGSILVAGGVSATASGVQAELVGHGPSRSSIPILSNH
jgi:hypothetical protein